MQALYWNLLLHKYVIYDSAKTGMRLTEIWTTVQLVGIM